MEKVIEMMLDSGRIGVDLSLYTIMPIMVIMMAIMNVLDKKNVLSWVARGFAPLLILFGLPGLGVFAIIQILFISFAAPVATLRIIERDENISDASLAATLAAILVMAQANAVFPLAAVGLNVPIGILTSLVGGLIASLIAFKILGGHSNAVSVVESERPHDKRKLVPLLFEGGEAGFNIVLKSIAPLIIAVFMVSLFKKIGIIEGLETILSPVLMKIGIPGIAVLPIVTKFMAGGTAMMAIVLDLMAEGAMTAAELNRIAGFTLNPLDPVGVAVLVATGPRVAKIAKPAMIAAFIGIVVRGVLHLIIF